MLINLNPIYEANGLIRFEGVISRCLKMLHDEDASMTEDASTVLMQLSFERNINDAFLTNEESFRLLFQYLSYDNVVTRRNVATILLNLSYRLETQTKITESGAISSLVMSLWSDTDLQVRRTALAVICNLVHDNAAAQEGLRQANANEVLRSLLIDGDDEVQLYAAATLHNVKEIISEDTVLAQEIIITSILNKPTLFDDPSIAKLVPMMIVLSEENEVVRTRAVVGLKQLSSVAANRDWMRDAGVVASLLNLLAHETNTEVIQNALQILSVLEVDEDEIEDAGGISPILNLLSNVDLNIRQDASQILRDLRFI
jgi:hypothetical protein